MMFIARLRRRLLLWALRRASTKDVLYELLRREGVDVIFHLSNEMYAWRGAYLTGPAFSILVTY